MRSSRVRLTLRTMIVAVAAVAVVLAVERFLYRSAARAVGSGADGDYIWGEAVTVWLFFNIALLFPALIVFVLSRLRPSDDSRTCPETTKRGQLTCDETD
jgi:hypothetical protein